jgi:maleate isomerase
MEPEFYSIAPRGVTIHSARLLLTDVTPNALIKMAEDTEKATSLLMTANVDVFVYGCTTGSLVGGVEWEKNLVDRIEKETGRCAVSTSGAIIEALQMLEVEDIGVATPYSMELNILEKKFLEDNGFHVTAIKGLGLLDNLSIGKVSLKTVESLVREVAYGSDAILISCTNLPTIRVIANLERELELPVVTSNQASIWAVMKENVKSAVTGYGELFRRL